MLPDQVGSKMNFYELNKIINEDDNWSMRKQAQLTHIKKFGRPIGFDGPVPLSKELEDELAKIGNIETEEEAREKWRKMQGPIDQERESQRQKEKEERWSPLLRSKEDDFKELDELEDWLNSQGHIPSDPDAWDMNDIEDVSAVYKTLGSHALDGPHDRKMIEKLGQHLKRLKSQRALAKMF
jgi:hypothetical protein